MSTANLPANRPAGNAVATIRDLFLKSKDQLAMALPRHMTVDRLIRVALTTIQRTPKLADCTPMSLMGALMESAQMGLEPDGMLGHAHLVPYFNNKTGAMEAKLIPGYKGLISLAYRSGAVSSIHAEVVYAKDKFDFAFGLVERLEHVPNLTGDRGERKAVYAVARMKDGSHAVVVLSMLQVEAIRKRSRAGESGPWVTDYDAMAAKTAVRQLAKWIPQSPELQGAAAKEDELDVVDVEFDVPTAPQVDMATGEVIEPPKRGRGRPRLADKLAEQKAAEAAHAVEMAAANTRLNTPQPGEDREPGDDTLPGV